MGGPGAAVRDRVATSGTTVVDEESLDPTDEVGSAVVVGSAMSASATELSVGGAVTSDVDDPAVTAGVRGGSVNGGRLWRLVMKGLAPYRSQRLSASEVNPRASSAGISTRSRVRSSRVGWYHPDHPGMGVGTPHCIKR